MILTYKQVNDGDSKSDRQNKEERHRLNVVEMRQKVKQIVNPNKYSVNQDVPLMDEDKTVRLRRLLSDLYPDNWGTAKDADEMAYDIKNPVVRFGL